MSVWTDRIKQLDVWKRLEELGPLLDQAMALTELAPASLDGLARLKAVLEFTGRRLAGADFQLLEPEELNKISGSLQGAINDVTPFLTDQDESHITGANVHADMILQHLTHVSIPTTTEDFEAVKKAANDYRSSLESNLRAVRESEKQLTMEIESLRGETADLATMIAAEKDGLSKIMTEQQGQFSANEGARAKEHTESEKDRQDRFNELTGAYKNALAESATQLETDRTAAGKDRAELLEEIDEDYRVKAEEILKVINEKKVEVDVLLGVIGNRGVTAGYQQAADRANRIVWFWQVITLLFMIGFVTAACVILLPVIKTGVFTWPAFAGRVFVAITFGIIAAYGGAEAAKYQSVERNNRKLALELAAIGPYLASLPQAEQDTFKIKLGEKAFGGVIDSPSVERSPSSMLDILKSKEVAKELEDLLDRVVTAAVKAAKP